MKSMRWLGALLLATVLSACGGGGGDSGSTQFGGGAGTTATTGGTTTTTPAVAANVVTVAVQRSAVAVSSITSTETAQATARVVTADGAPVVGVVVRFGEANATLLKFAPTSATALTGVDGIATIDISALSASATGATAVTASTTIGSVPYSGSSSFEIKAGSVVGAVPPKAINFVSVNPSDRAIVIKGAGGSGRSESATLTFKVVDGSGAPVNGATVNFLASPANQVTLNIPTAVSNSDGLVTTTVQSGSTATSVIIVATAAADSTVSSQSDSLIVSNGIPIPAGFEVVAEQYNLDGHLTGDSTVVSAFVRDQFGNPVADGLAVSFTTDFGVVASSILGGCTTVNGQCSVDFRVQNPRGTGIATVVGSARVGATDVVSDSIQLNMAGATGGTYLATKLDGTALNSITLASCSTSVELLLTDGNGHAAAAGSKISVSAASAGITSSVVGGGTVLDQLAINFPPTPFAVVVDLGVVTDPDGVITGCAALADGTSGFIWLTFETPNQVSFIQKVAVQKSP